MYRMVNQENRINDNCAAQQLIQNNLNGQGQAGGLYNFVSKSEHQSTSRRLLPHIITIQEDFKLAETGERRLSRYVQ
jgi:hypothetical protein